MEDVRRARNRSGWSRRSALLTLGSLVPLSPLWTWGSWAGSTADPPLEGALLARFASTFATDPDLDGLAGTYRTQFPAEADRTTLTRLVLQALHSPGPWAGSRIRDVQALREALLEIIREEFRTSETVALQGWILSRTEARLLLWRSLERR